MSKTTKACLMAGLLLVGLAINARATMPVVDYSHIAQHAANEFVNLAKWTKTEVD